MNIQIKKINTNRKVFLDLLLLADPEENIVLDYINSGHMFILYEDSIPTSLALVIRHSSNIGEIKNLATSKDRQKRGYASRLLNYIFIYYKNYFDQLIIGTANSSLSNISFYKSLAFKEYKTIKNFFVDNYKNPIYENGIQATDIIYLKKHIKN